MSEFHLLIDAAIRHLESLQESGARSVPVSRKTLAELASAPSSERGAGAASSVRTSAPRDMTRPATGAAAPAPGASTKSVPGSVAARWSQSLKPTAPAPPRRTEALVEPPVPAPTPRLDAGAKISAMEALRSRAQSCTKCPHLVASRKSVVVGVGDPAARLMFVGEAPGAEEDRRGEPFVGAAGELLTKILGAMNLSRDQVFIANVLKCRPDTPGQPTGNRKPTPAEMATCLPWLEEQIGIIQPEVLVALGATAVEGLLGKTAGIMKLRGHWQTYRGVPVMPTFHPAFVLRSETPTVKRQVWEDMLAVMERLSLPITERQRGFFLPRAGG